MVSLPFNLKSIRRKSRADFRTNPSREDTSSEGSQGYVNGNGPTPTSGSLTPPSLNAHSDTALDFGPPPGATDNLPGHANVGPIGPSGMPLAPAQPGTRPPLTTDFSKRRSVSGMAGLGSPLNGPGRSPALPMSPYSPRINNINDKSWVYQKILLVNGTIGDPGGKLMDGTITVSRADDAIAPVHWPVSDSQWKALVYLMPGANKIRFDFSSPKLTNSGSSNPIHSCHITLHMLPPNNSPPLQLAILMGKDSPGTFDAIPARIEREGNNLEAAVRKFRMAAYLWQAFTAEQMSRNRLGRRVFRFDEEWTQGSAFWRDREFGTMRSEARVHIVRTDLTVEELRNIHLAQQNQGGADRGGLYGIAMDALRKHFNPRPGQKLYISTMILDSHWDKQSNTILAHAALGGGAGDLNVGIFGSHCLQSYPTSFEEVAPAFSDCTPTDLDYVANDCNEAGSSWEACNIGIGAHLHETGHLLGLPHRPSGVMLRDYVRFNRSFLAREAYSTRTREKGGIVTESDECTWHRLDCLHFRGHPCFRLPNDPPVNPDDSIQAWTVEGGSVMVTAATGVAYIEMYGETDDVCHTWIEFGGDLPNNGIPPNNVGAWSGANLSGANSNGIQRQILLTEDELRARMPEEKKNGKLRIVVRSVGGGAHSIDDLGALCNKKDASIKLGGGKVAFRSGKLGECGSEPVETIFTSALRQDRVMSRIQVWSGSALDGVEFIYDDDSRQLFGKIGGKPGGDVFELDVRRGEYISGFNMRAGAWIDGIQILTSLGRRSPMYGNPHGGGSHTLIPPRGYSICGVSGTCGGWLDGFSVLITRH